MSSGVSMGTAARYRVRQNPVPGGTPAQVPQIRPEWCPVHGHYIPTRNAVTVARRAVSGEDSTVRSWRLLDTAARMRRTCRLCRGPHPSMRQWAESIRERLDRMRQEDQGQGRE